jgi:hypothetical protein
VQNGSLLKPGREAHQEKTDCGLHLLEPRLVDSDTTVVIPFDERVLFIHSPNCAKFSSRDSEIAQSLDAISGGEILASSRRFGKRWLPGTVGISGSPGV